MLKPVISKYIFIFEILLIAVPLTGLFGYWLVLLTHLTLTGISQVGVMVYLQSLLVTACITAFYILAYKFLRYGSSGLFKAPAFAWSFLMIGILYSLLGIFPYVISLFGMFGLPLILPSIHLLLENRHYQPEPFIVTTQGR